MQQYKFQIFSPGGNDTALVFGLDFDKETRKNIDYDIRNQYKVVEQVGFVEKKDGVYRLEMAGGEFCGNATRCAANYFLGNKNGEISICVSGVSRILKAGVNQINTAWAEMPVGTSLNSVSTTDEGFYLVILEGIVHLIIPSDKSTQFLSKARSVEFSFIDELKSIAKVLMEKYSLTKYPACGVMFLEEKSDVLQMHPCVLVTGVKSSMYYETACGSGSIAVTMVYASLCNKSVKQTIIQPSKHSIIAVVEISEKNIVNAYIDGAVIAQEETITRRL